MLYSEQDNKIFIKQVREVAVKEKVYIEQTNKSVKENNYAKRNKTSSTRKIARQNTNK